jgi:hypothetical protein
MTDALALAALDNPVRAERQLRTTGTVATLMGVSASLKAVWGKSSGGTAMTSASRSSSPMRTIQRKRRTLTPKWPGMHITRCAPSLSTAGGEGLSGARERGADAKVRIKIT